MLSSSSTSSNVEKTKEESGSVGDGKQQQPQPQQICNPIINNSNNNNHSAIILSDITSVTLHRGELPGYTGWARPEFTVSIPLLSLLVALLLDWHMFDWCFL